MREFLIEEWLIVVTLLAVIAVMTAWTAVANYRNSIRVRYSRLIHDIADVSITSKLRNPVEEELEFIKLCAVHTTARGDGKYIVSVAGPYELDVHLWVCRDRESAVAVEETVTAKIKRWMTLPLADRPGVINITKLGEPRD